MNYRVEIIMEGTVVRLDMFGEVHEGRFVAFMDRDTGMQMARVLGQAASHLPPGRQQRKLEDLNPEDLA